MPDDPTSPDAEWIMRRLETLVIVTEAKGVDYWQLAVMLRRAIDELKRLEAAADDMPAGVRRAPDS